MASGMASAKTAKTASDAGGFESRGLNSTLRSAGESETALRSETESSNAPVSRTVPKGFARFCNIDSALS